MSFNNNILLFPLCDKRGTVYRILAKKPVCHHELLHSPDNLFYAWLTDLPRSLSVAAVATTILQVSGIERQAPGLNSPDSRRLYELLNELRSKKPVC